MTAATPSPRRPLRSVFSRRGVDLPAARVSARLSAYVYGHILALAALAVSTPSTIESGEASVLVVGTGLTTYIAHVFADVVAYTNVTAGDGASTESLKRRVVKEFRDATPILTSAALPAGLLALGWLGALSPTWSFVVAGGVVVVRIGSVNLIVERLRGRPLTFALVLAGLATAAVAALIVVAKVVLTY